MSNFLTDEEMAGHALEYVERHYRSCSGIEKLNLMLRHIEESHYHTVSQGIIDACRAITTKQKEEMLS